MKREVYEPQRIYPKQIINPQHITATNQPEINIVFKEQITPFTPYHPNRPNSVTFNKTFCDRFSHDVMPNDQLHPNHTFVHLRNEISNLRSEFSKLIQKDQVKLLDKSAAAYKERDVKGNSMAKKDNRIQANSAIAFYNKISQPQKIQKEAEKRSVLEPMYKANEYKSVIFENYDKNSQNSFSNMQSNSKIMTKSHFVREETAVPSQQSSKLHDYQLQIFKNDQLRKRTQEQANFLKNHLKEKQRQFSERLQEVRNRNKYLQRQVKRYEDQMKKQRQKYESQLSTIQQIHQINLKQILSNYERAEQELQTKKQELNQANIVSSDKEIQYSKMNQKAIILQKANNFLQNQLQKSKKECQFLGKQVQQFKRKLKQKESGYEIQGTIKQQKPGRIKQLEGQNEDLQKRVDSYKKIIQQLNISINSSRQKLTKTLQELKILKEENTKKQALINSLYRDITILDKEMRGLLVFKSVNATNQKLIDELTHTILHLQCQHLNDKYREKESFLR